MKTALVVDNSRLMRIMIKELLSENGIQAVGEAGDVPEAIEAYKALKPDLVTLDLIMPSGSGLDVLKAIMAENPKANVIICTETGQPTLDQEVVKQGARALLHKPVTSEAMTKCLQHIRASSAEGGAAKPKTRVLVVDDSVMMRAMVKELLVENNLEVVGEAADVPSGIKAYDDLRPDLVTLDIIMPGGSGIDVLRHIMGQNKQARVIMVTSISQEKINSEALQLGAKHILNKPLTSDGMKAALEKALPKPEDGHNHDGHAHESSEITQQQVERLANLFKASADSSIKAMDTMCKTSWTLEGIQLHEGTGSECAALADQIVQKQIIAVQMIVAKDIPMMCFCISSKEGADKIARSLMHNESQPNEDIVRLVLMEWANILITAVLNVFANATGNAILSSPPELLEWPVREIISRASKELCDLPDRIFLAHTEFASEKLGADCETLFLFRVDTVRKLADLSAQFEASQNAAAAK